jgi:hypothetical protein
VQSTPAAPHSPTVYALLIGISDYTSSNLLSLSGPPNDIALMRDVLIKRFKVDPGNITQLLENQATHTAIEHAFEELAKRVNPGDRIYIHYSGHGSTAPDPLEERTHEDQTWVGFAARSATARGNDSFDVLDKEIANWLQPLYAKTDDVVFVSDSCHSATAARGEPHGSRGVDRDARPNPLLQRIKRLPPPTTGLRIGAARDFENAVEFDPADGRACSDKTRCNGVFTWYWAQALGQAQPGESWMDVYNRASALVTTQYGVSQRPQAEGFDRLVFGGKFTRLQQTVPIVAVGSDKKTVELGAGMAAFVTKGSTYRLYAGQTPEKPDAPMLEVSAPKLFTSTANVTKGAFRVSDLVVESRHAYSFEPMRLFVGGDFAPGIDAALVQKLRGGVAALSGFTLVDDRSKADFWVYVVRPKATAGGGRAAADLRLPDASEPGAPPVAWVVSRQGVLVHERMRVPMDPPDSGIVTVTDDLRKFAWSREIKRLAAQGNSFPVRLTVKVLRGPNADSLKTVTAFPVTAITPAVHYKDYLGFDLENTDQKRPWYAYIVAVGPDAAIRRIHPQVVDNEDEARLTPKEKYSAPARYYLDEIGSETLILVVTANPIDPRIMEQPGYRLRGDKPASQLELILSAAHTRGEVVSPIEQWGSVSTAIEVRRPSTP